MLVDLPYRHAWFAALCLVPAVLRWWAGRALRAHLDDPLLPERLVAQRRRNQQVLGFVLAGSVVVGTFDDLIWAIPLLVITRAAAAYPLRRALYDERWSLAGYLVWMGRLLLGFVGFRLLVALVPLLVVAAGSFDWIAAIALGALLFFWHARSADWFRFILGTRPLDGGPLLARFEAMAAASTAPKPRFEVIHLHGGAIANAVALPSRRGSSVVYTDTLLRLLDADESAAITAHEIAHLEHFDAARLRVLNRIMSGLIAVAIGAPLLGRLVPGLPVLALETAWVAVYAFALAWTVRDHQRNETASDLRAIALCGDPEALVRALVKVYMFSRVPRRWDTQMEHAATHPSLARRIRAIRAAAAASDPASSSAAAPSSASTPSAAPSTSDTLRSADGRVVVTIADALHWQEAEGVLHVLPYAQLTELRLDVRDRAATRLVAVERGGRRWEAALDAADAARAQTILDRVDGRLAEPPPRTLAIPWLQAAGAIVAISAMWAGHFAVALVAIGASLRSAAAFFAAAGAAALGAAALVGREAIEGGAFAAAWPALLLLVFGVALLAGAWRKRHDDSGRLVNAGTAGLAALALLCVGAIAMRGGDVVRLYQASAALPAAAVLPLALAGALAMRPRRAWRIAAVPVCLVGLMIGIAGSGSFLHAFGRDPFLVDAPLLPVQTLTGSPVADVTLPGILSGLRLSPGGTRIALMKYTAGPRPVMRFSVGAPGSGFTSIAATDLLFLDDDRVLAMTVDGVRARLQELRVGSDSAAWEQSIENLAGPRLAYRRGSNRWVVTGMDDEGRLVSVEGIVGGGSLTRREWNLMDRDEVTEAWAIEGDTALRAQRGFGFDPRGGGALALTLMAMLDGLETRLTRITPAGRTDVAVSRLETFCTDHAFNGERLVCMAYDGARTHVFAFAPAADTPDAIGSLAGHFLASMPTREGWVSGWTTTGLGAVNLPGYVALDLVSRRLVAVPGELRAEEVTAAGDVAAIVTHDTSSTRVRLYALAR
jgi:Zn-dependent protease with chaperone function